MFVLEYVVPSRYMVACRFNGFAHGGESYFCTHGRRDAFRSAIFRLTTVLSCGVEQVELRAMLFPRRPGSLGRPSTKSHPRVIFLLVPYSDPALLQSAFSSRQAVFVVAPSAPNSALSLNLPQPPRVLPLLALSLAHNNKTLVVYP